MIRIKIRGKAIAVGVVIALVPLIAQADRVFQEVKLGEVTGGYEAKRDQTLVRQFYLRAVGPDDLGLEAERHARRCVQDTLTASMVAVQATPGEAGVKLMAGLKTWNIEFPRCMSVKGFLRAYADRFNIELHERKEPRDGMHLVARVDQNPAALQAQAIDWMVDKTGAVAFRPVAEGYRAWGRATDVNIDMSLPKEVSSNIRVFANVAEHLDGARIDAQKQMEREHAAAAEHLRLEAESARQRAEALVQAAQEEARRQAERAQEELREQVERSRREAEARIRQMQAEAQRQVEAARREAERQIEAARREAERLAEVANRELEDKRRKAQQAGEWLGARTGIRIF